MSQVSVDSFIYGTNSIAKEKPVYKIGHDGSDGSCDGMGLLRGGLLRSGAIKIQNMKEPNQFARYTAVNLRKIDSCVKRGSILLKTRDMNDNSMPLPSRYRSGGNDYTGDSTNYVDVALVIRDNPVEILFMTKDGAVKSDTIKGWGYVCELPYVLYGRVKETMESAYVKSNDGSSIKMYAEKSFSCQDITNIPDGTMVIKQESCAPWVKISYGEKQGYVLQKFIKTADTNKELTISQEDYEKLKKAYLILGGILGYIK